ncbi:MAG: DUF4011 domain-containing protein [Desulfovibrio sp.]|nr:DUF4011 domain-containing protein [Desulfovibrio sp.]
MCADGTARKLNALMIKYPYMEQETSINVLHVVFGFLEWAEPTALVVPLLL